VARFEGSYLGDRSKIGPETKLECKVPVRLRSGGRRPGVADRAGRRFTRCRHHWGPNCSGDKEQFMVVEDAQ
jgi:hypothetical protein